jgi:hypothetical protein
VTSSALARRPRQPVTEQKISRPLSGQCLVRIVCNDDVDRRDHSGDTQEVAAVSMATLESERASDNRYNSPQARDLQRPKAVGNVDQE